MKSVIVATLSLSLVLVACLDLGVEPSPIHYQDDIREAFFLYQFNHNYSGIRQSAAFYALASAELVWVPNPDPYPPSPWFRNETDLSDQFMNRFVHNNPPVTKLSDCFIGPDSSGYITVWDRTKTKRGLLFEVSQIIVQSNNQVQVWGGYYENPMSFSLEIYYMSGNAHTWRVDSTFLRSIG